jgi:hypothetical protein
MCQDQSSSGAVIVFERVAGFALAITLTSLLSREKLQYLTFWYGHGHALLAWVYRYSAQGQAGARGRTVALFLLLNGGLFAAYYSTATPWFGPLALLTSLFFLYHLLTDEVYLFKVPLNLRESPLHLGRFLEALFLFVMAAAPLLDGLPFYGPQLWARLGMPGFSWSWLSMPLGGLVLLLYAGVIHRGFHRPDWGSLYLLGCGVAVALFNQCCGPFAHYQWFSFVVILHVTHWYIHYFFHARSSPQRLRLYLTRVAASNAFFLLLVLPVFLDFGVAARAVGVAVYGIQNYYLWTLAHLLVSTRAHDFASFLRPAGPPGVAGSDS